MDSFVIKTFNEFVNEIDAIDDYEETILFRGQNVKRNLLPSIARKDPTINTTSIEKRTLQELSRLGTRFLKEEAHIHSEWDLLVKAQHFGLHTRLLDWTSNPLCALWFACSNNEKKNGYVYILNPSGFLSDGTSGPFKTGKTRVFKPNLNNERIIAQHGWFTAHIFSNKAKQFVKLERNTDIKTKIFEIIIPYNNKEDILLSLDKFGINQRTLFPDIEGLCKYLNWQKSL